MPREPINLDNIDRKIIILLNQNARITPTQASKIIGRSREFIDYRIKKLIQRKYFNSFTITVSNKKLGFETYQILIKLQNYTIEKQKEIINYLAQHPNVKILERCSGDWDLLVKPVFKDKYYLVNFLDNVNEKFGDIILSYEMLIDHIPIKHEDISFISSFKLKSEEKKRLTHKYYRDKKDRTILKTLAKDSRMKLIELSRKTSIPIDTCISRFNRLVRNGVITNFKGIINFEKFDMQFYYIFLRINKFSEERRKKITDLFKKENRIVYAGRVIGNWDLVIQIASKNQKEFDMQMNNIRTHLKYDIKQYAFAMIIENIKKEPYPKGMF